MKIVNKLVIVAAAISILFVFGVSESIAQKDKSEKSGWKVELKKDASTNGYKVVKKGDNYYIQANNVSDPLTKKLIEGFYALSYGCAGSNADKKDGSATVAEIAVAPEDVSVVPRGESKTFFAVEALRNISMDFDRGNGLEFVSLTGPSGSGKTTCIIEPVFIHTRDQSHRMPIKLEKNAEKNGYKTTKEGETFLFKANDVVDPISKKLLEGLKVLRYMCGSNGPAKRKTVFLSGGQSQRVAIACALLREPSILLLDEPTSGLGEVVLTKGAKTNGYFLIRRGGKIYLWGEGVEDPKTKKPIEGIHTISYGCETPMTIQSKDVAWSQGRMGRLEIACTFIHRPTVIVGVVENSN